MMDNFDPDHLACVDESEINLFRNNFTNNFHKTLSESINVISLIID